MRISVIPAIVVRKPWINRPKRICEGRKSPTSRTTPITPGNLFIKGSGFIAERNARTVPGTSLQAPRKRKMDCFVVTLLAMTWAHFLFNISRHRERSIFLAARMDCFAPRSNDGRGSFVRMSTQRANFPRHRRSGFAAHDVVSLPMILRSIHQRELQ